MSPLAKFACCRLDPIQLNQL